MKKLEINKENLAYLKEVAVDAWENLKLVANDFVTYIRPILDTTIKQFSAKPDAKPDAFSTEKMQKQNNDALENVVAEKIREQAKYITDGKSSFLIVLAHTKTTLDQNRTFCETFTKEIMCNLESIFEVVDAFVIENYDFTFDDWNKNELLEELNLNGFRRISKRTETELKQLLVVDLKKATEKQADFVTNDFTVIR